MRQFWLTSSCSVSENPAEFEEKEHPCSVIPLLFALIPTFFFFILSANAALSSCTLSHPLTPLLSSSCVARCWLPLVSPSVWAAASLVIGERALVSLSHSGSSYVAFTLNHCFPSHEHFSRAYRVCFPLFCPTSSDWEILIKRARCEVELSNSPAVLIGTYYQCKAAWVERLAPSPHNKKVSAWVSSRSPKTCRLTGYWQL